MSSSSAAAAIEGFALTTGKEAVLVETHKTLIVAGTLRLATTSCSEDAGLADSSPLLLTNVCGKTWQYGTRPMLESMVSELQVMQQLGRHDCILHGYGIAETKSAPAAAAAAAATSATPLPPSRQWLVMERWDFSLEDALLGKVDGVALEGSICRLEILVDVGRGVLHMHASHILHRDIALRNVMLRCKTGMQERDGHQEQESGKDSSGSSNCGLQVSRKTRFSACVADFGNSVAAVSEEDGGGEAAFRPKSNALSLYGPVRSTAPEALSVDAEAGYPVYSTASDVWSFGVTIWALLVQRQPYSDVSSNPAAVRQHVLEGGGRLPQVRSCRGTGVVAEFDEVSLDALDDLLDRCFSFDPQLRPSAKEVTLKLAWLLERQR